jgi:hypothetical protein
VPGTGLFLAGQLPPVDGFWSLEMISVPDVRYVESPVNRYVIDSRMAGLKKNADGSPKSRSRGIRRDRNWNRIGCRTQWRIFADAAALCAQGGSGGWALEAGVPGTVVI